MSSPSCVESGGKKTEVTCLPKDWNKSDSFSLVGRIPPVIPEGPESPFMDQSSSKFPTKNIHHKVESN